MSMYRGTKPFDREQLVFIVEAALSAAFDKVEADLPVFNKIVGGKELELWQEREQRSKQFIFGAVGQVGIFIPILWAQTEGKRISDGMGTEDFDGWSDFEKMVNYFITHNTTKGHVPMEVPDLRPLAEKIVDANWGDYFEESKTQGDVFEAMQNQGFHPDTINRLADVVHICGIMADHLSEDSSDQYIEEVPSFETMYQVRKEIDDLIEAMESLNQGHDVVQRATDLDTMAQSLYESVRRMVTVTD